MNQDVNVDVIYKGDYQGSVAHRLLANGMDVKSLRTNATLLYDEWKHIDTAILKAAQERLSAVDLLNRKGLVYTIPNGMATTVLAYQDASDTEGAEVDMDGVSKARRDRPEFDINYLPLPIVHKDFSFSSREISASRNGNMPLDTTMAELAARKVAEKIEEFLLTGSSTYTFGGGAIYGILDAQNRNTGSLGTAWDASAATGTTILTDVLAMKQALIDDYHYGPYALLVPGNYETQLDEDHTDNYGKSRRSRIEEVSSIEEVLVCDKLTDSNVALVQLSADVVRMVNGLSITTVEWSSEGGMRHNFKVMAIMVPQVRYDQNLRSGIAHYS